MVGRESCRRVGRRVWAGRRACLVRLVRRGRRRARVGLGCIGRIGFGLEDRWRIGRVAGGMMLGSGVGMWAVVERVGLRKKVGSLVVVETPRRWVVEVVEGESRTGSFAVECLLAAGRGRMLRTDVDLAVVAVAAEVVRRNRLVVASAG